MRFGYNPHIKLRARLGSRKIGLRPPQYVNTDRSKAVLLLWFLTVTCSCCPYLHFGSPIILVEGGVTLILQKIDSFIHPHSCSQTVFGFAISSLFWA